MVIGRGPNGLDNLGGVGVGVGGGGISRLLVLLSISIWQWTAGLPIPRDVCIPSSYGRGASEHISIEKMTTFPTSIYDLQKCPRAARR